MIDPRFQALLLVLILCITIRMYGSTYLNTQGESDASRKITKGRPQEYPLLPPPQGHLSLSLSSED